MLTTPQAAANESGLQLLTLIEKALGPASLSINHVGSTAGPEINAKVINDLDF